MQYEKPAMVIVVNEFGGTVGLVTIQDIIAEIIGNSSESKSNASLLIEILDQQTFLVQAQTNLEEVNQVLQINLPLARQYQTLGGFLLYQMQKIPDIGEVFIYENLEFTVLSAIGPRLHQIKIHQEQQKED
jgi:CBS domain containing-hemolysin-like protein